MATARMNPATGKPEVVIRPKSPPSPIEHGKANLSRPPNVAWASLSRGTSRKPQSVLVALEALRRATSTSTSPPALVLPWIRIFSSPSQVLCMTLDLGHHLPLHNEDARVDEYPERPDCWRKRPQHPEEAHPAPQSCDQTSCTFAHGIERDDPGGLQPVVDIGWAENEVSTGIDGEDRHVGSLIEALSHLECLEFRQDFGRILDL